VAGQAVTIVAQTAGNAAQFALTLSGTLAGRVVGWATS